MASDAEYNKLAIKFASVEEKVLEIEKVARMVEIWAKDNDYELIPVVKMLNNKVRQAIDTFRG